MAFTFYIDTSIDASAAAAVLASTACGKPGKWQNHPPCPSGKNLEPRKRMKILKKTFVISKAFDYISAPRQTEHV